jgi:xylulokinase
MASQSPLYIGFDLSTQQLKGLVVNSDLKVEYIAKFDFDADSTGFPIKKGVMTNEAEHEVFAPVALWLQALDTVLESLRKQGLDFSRVKGISGAGQQHGSVYWSSDAEELLKKLDAKRSLEEQLPSAFSHPYSPNWQDASTQKECDEFDAALGSPEELAQATGSKAHHVRGFAWSRCGFGSINLADIACRDSQVLKSFDSRGNTRTCIRRRPEFRLSHLSLHRFSSATLRLLISQTCVE